MNTKKSSEEVQPQKQELTHEQLLEALYYIFDAMDRALMNFVLVGDTARSAMQNRLLTGDKVTVAVRRNEWESGARRIVDAFAKPKEETKTIVKYEVNGVPIVLHVLEEDTTIKSPNTLIYQNEYFKIPNPFSEFEKIFSFIK